MFAHCRSRVFLALLTLIVLASGVLTFVPKIPPVTVGVSKTQAVATHMRAAEQARTVQSPTPESSNQPAIPPKGQVDSAVATTKLPSPASPAIHKEEVAPVAGPDVAGLPTLVHTVKPGESVGAIAYRYLPQTTFMMTGELEAAIRQANPGLTGKHLQPGQQIVIPGIEAAPPEALRPAPLPKSAEIRAIYLTGWTAGSAQGLDLIRRWRALGGNAVVFDLKDFDGLVNVSFSHPLAPEKQRPPIRSLTKLVRLLRRLNLQSIGRIALFRDEELATHHPELAVQSRRSKAPWRENGKPVWADPSRREVQDYNIALARHGAEAGIDEIQFDYVRFPAEGDQADAQFSFQSEHPEWPRTRVIADFLERAYTELHPLGVLVSLDVFGVMAWQRPVDLAHTGQDIPAMARHCDVLSPMIYPSHFFGMDGIAKPGDAPEHFIGESMDRFRKVTAGLDVILRPWLQAFAWRTKTYSPDYVHTQMKVAREKGGIGYLFWNARNDYSVPFQAIRQSSVVAGRTSPEGLPPMANAVASAPLVTPLLTPKPSGAETASRSRIAPAEESPAAQGAAADR